MNILMVYPKYPDTFWSFKHALKFIDKKAANPPLGLITVSALLPKHWSKKLIDTNVEKLKQAHINWADYIFISAMNIQRQSAEEIIGWGQRNGKKIVAGGPLFTEEPESFQHVDHLVLNEAEITLPQFLEDLGNEQPKQIYTSDLFPNIADSPLPDYHLLNLNKYVSMNLQYTRGCPFNCEFCNITSLFGKKVRLKPSAKVIGELQAIYDLGWRGNIFFVDDNFIGNKKNLKKELLPDLITWVKDRKMPFNFNTEASINMADDDDLLELMTQAGFNCVFIGIESPEEESLSGCFKLQNTNRDMVSDVHKIQDYGIQVSAGFIVGFDNDKTSVFKKQIDFINQTGIVSAMVGLLNAPRKSQLYERLKLEGRINKSMSGDNTDFTINFKPKMQLDVLMKGYRQIILEIYSAPQYYARVKALLKRVGAQNAGFQKFSLQHIWAFIKSIFLIGMADNGRRHFWKILFWSLTNKPSVFASVITFSIYGYHFRKVFNINQ
jgi:radical SAM superfamily enzyme YgiQ (UPF0313 family)